MLTKQAKTVVMVKVHATLTIVFLCLFYTNVYLHSPYNTKKHNVRTVCNVLSLRLCIRCCWVLLHYNNCFIVSSPLTCFFDYLE